MIKTRINRHDLEYYTYAMIKSFFKEAEVIAPDTLEHNLPQDDEPMADIFECRIENDSFAITVTPGRYLTKNYDNEWKLAGKDDAEVKEEIHGIIYDALCEYTGECLPWGNLTGIRPTKLYLKKILEYAHADNTNAGNTEVNCLDAGVDKAIADMRRVHRVSEAKGILAADIAVREQNLLNTLSGKAGYSVYVGIPFCPSTCLYCSFTSNPIFSYKDKVAPYLDCVRQELVCTSQIMKGRILDTIYIGGGTPTTLSPDEMDKLLGNIVDTLDVSQLKEFTVEAGRPDSITREKLEVIKKYPVTRISVNPQTMLNSTLKTIGRHHSVEDTIEAFNMARDLGFDNINMDMILGLPGESLEDIEYTVNEISKLSPDSLTVHSLAIKRASRMKEWIEKNNIKRNLDFDRAMDLAIAGAKAMGMKPYYLYRQKDMGGNLENTGFAKDGKYGIYNILIMEEVQTIIACGAGTVSKRVFADGHIERCDTVKDVNLYISKIEEMIDRKRQLFSTIERNYETSCCVNND